MTTCDPHRTAPRARAPVSRGLSWVLAVVACHIGCSRPADVIETGAVLLHLSVSEESPVPDELRVWIYDDAGVVFENARIPEQGPLMPVVAGGPNLGSVLIQPGVSHGTLRIHVRGLQDGARTLDGVALVPSDARARGTFDLTLGSEIPVDLDNDDVPDLIDDCLAQADPDQGGCPDPGTPEGSTAADAGAVDASPDQLDAARGGATGTAGRDGLGGEGDIAGVAGSGGAGGRADTGGGGTANPAGSGGRAGAAGGLGAGGKPGTGGAASGNGGNGGFTVDGGTHDAAALDARPADVTGPAEDGQTDGQTDGKASATGSKVLGSPCASSSECSSSFCADGECCQSACDKPCQVCGLFGLCLPVKRVPDIPQCTGTSSCDMRGICVAN